MVPNANDHCGKGQHIGNLLAVNIRISGTDQNCSQKDKSRAVITEKKFR